LHVSNGFTGCASVTVLSWELQEIKMRREGIKAKKQFCAFSRIGDMKML
jgi:hypothetical protein